MIKYQAQLLWETIMFCKGREETELKPEESRSQNEWIALFDNPNNPIWQEYRNSGCRLDIQKLNDLLRLELEFPISSCI